MKLFPVSLLFLMLPAFAGAQTQGVVNCEHEMGIPVWEQPGSIMQLKQVSCGQDVTILGSDGAYFRILIAGNLVGYVEAKYVRPLDDRGVNSPETGAQSAVKEETAHPETSSDSPEPPPTADRRKSATSSQKRADREFPVLKSGFEVGVEASEIQYKEPGIMKERGMMLGVYANYTIHPEKFMVKLETRFALGNLDYSSPFSGTMNDIRDYVSESRFAFGRDFHVARSSYLAPYIGLGFRYLRDESGGLISSAGHFGYDRESNYLYTPIGLAAITRVKRTWFMGGEVEYDHFWHGWQYSELGDVFQEDIVAKNDQPEGWGARGSVSLTKYCGRYGFSVQPYLRYWNINESDINLGGLEPDNNSTEWGVRFGVKF